MPEFPEGPEAVRAIADVSRETLDALSLYADLLRRWQRTTQLVAPSTLDTLWSRHMADSAQLLRLAPGARRWADLGSGGGFPGLVVALCMRGVEGALVHLVESNARKCAFLRAVIRETGAPARVHDARIEAVLPSLAHELDVVTARALAPLSKLLRLAAPALRAGCIGLFMKGEEARGELTAAERIWNMRAELLPSLTDPKAAIIKVEDLGTPESGGPSERHS
jgi:16S rRNA (guanine527-N7)-methyltransferase